MKSIFTSFAILLFAFFPLSFCFSQNFTLRSQTDVDAFDTSITNVSGNLTIEPNLMTSIPITNLDNLSNLTFIGGDVLITRNSSLTNIDGLSNITAIEGNLEISKNIALPNINGVQNLTTLGGDLRIFGDEVLTNIEGISNLSVIQGNLRIAANFILTNIDGANNLTQIGGGLLVGYNPILANIGGFSNLTTVSGGVQLIENALLTNVDGFSNLVSVGGFLSISSHPALTNVDGLGSLTSVGDTNGEFELISGLNISNNTALTNLNGLANLANVDGDLQLIFNSALTDCCGVQNLLSTSGAIGGTISIYSNPSQCSSQAEILTALCEPSSLSELNLGGYSIQPNPSQGIFNVKFGDLNVNKKITKCQTTNTLGQVVYNEILGDSSSEAFQIDLTKHTKGIYFYSFFDKNNRILATGKLVKE